MPRPTRIRPLRAPLLSRRSLSLIVMVALAFAVFALWTGPEGSVRFAFARWLKARIGSGLFHHYGLGDIDAAIDLGARRAAVKPQPPIQKPHTPRAEGAVVGPGQSAVALHRPYPPRHYNDSVKRKKRHQ